MYFFDLDGTLLDSNGVWLDIDIEFLGRHGVSPVPEDYTDYVTHHTFHDAAEYTRARFSLPMTGAEIVAAWQEMAREAYGGTLPLKPGARDFLARANRTGIRCALLTSCMPDLCRAALEAHGLSPLLERVLTTAELGLEKREPALYLRAAELCMNCGNVSRGDVIAKVGSTGAATGPHLHFELMHNDTYLNPEFYL